MPSLFGRLNGRGTKPSTSKFGQGISSSDLTAAFPHSPSSQDATELGPDPVLPTSLDSEGEEKALPEGPNGDAVLAERSLNQGGQHQQPLPVPPSDSAVVLDTAAKHMPPVDRAMLLTASPASPTKSGASRPRGTHTNAYAEFGAGHLLSTSTMTQSKTPHASPVQPGSRMHKTLPSRPVSQKPSTIGSLMSSTSRSRTTSAVRAADMDTDKPVQPPVYGYTTLGWDKQMDVPQVAELVLMCGEQIRMRGLTSPLIFSSMALDISQHKITGLIRTFLTSPKEFYSSETKFSNPHDLAALIKWALARIGRVFPVPIPPTEMNGSRKADAQEEHVFIRQRGFLEWDSYVAWKTYERNANYPIAAFSAFLDGLPSSTAALLVALFSLLSSTTSYSLRNGMTPSRLARIFGALTFGLPEDETFEKTYDAYIRVSNATEHLLLAYIRDMSTVEPLPTRLADHVRAYPSTLSTDINQPGRGVRGVPFTLISRAVRLYSVDLVQQGRALDMSHQSVEWSACLGRGEGVQHDPQLSDRYCKLIDHRAGRTGVMDEGTGASGSQNIDSYHSLADKAWDEFIHDGFAAPDANKLAFDLNESERKARYRGRGSVQWSQFETSGFSLADDGLQSVLAFDDLLEEDVKRFPEDRAEIMQKLRKTQKAMPAFQYDTTPLVVSSPAMCGDPQGQWHEKPFSRMDEVFPEVYADILLGNGWHNRDELTHRNANFAIVQYKSRPTKSTVGSQEVEKARPSPPSTSSPEVGHLSFDDRTDASWFVIEEVVPAQYRSDLEAAGRRKNRSRASLRNLSLFRKLKTVNSGNHSGGGGTGIMSDSFFDEVFRPGLGMPTKKLTLGTSNLTSGSRFDDQSSTIRNASIMSSHQDDGAQPTSSVRLLSSLKARASKRLRKMTRDDVSPVDGSAPPLPPPKSAGVQQQSNSFTSEDFDARSLDDDEIRQMARPNTGKASALKSAFRVGNGEEAKDDAWLDIQVHKGERRGRASDGPQPPYRGRSATEGSSVMQTSAREAAVPASEVPSTIAITAAGWSRDEIMPTPAGQSSKQDQGEKEGTVSGFTRQTASDDTKTSKAGKEGEKSTILSALSALTTMSPGPPLAAHEVPPVGRKSIEPDTTSSATTPRSAVPTGSVPAEADTSKEADDSLADASAVSLPHLRALPQRGTGNDEDRQRARDARIEAAKERARQLREKLNPVAVDDLERRRAARDTNSSGPSAVAGLRATLIPVKTGSTLNTSPTSPHDGEIPVRRTSGSKPKDDPFAKNRVTGRVASMTNKFGGAPAKPITPQSTGDGVRTKTQNLSPVPTKGTSSAAVAPTDLSTSLAKSSSTPAARSQAPQPAVNLHGWTAETIAHPPGVDAIDAMSTRPSVDSNLARLDAESIYPDDAASNFAPDPEDDAITSNGLHRLSDQLRSEAEDRPTAMPPGFAQRYQPGMPLSNVEEERESVLSGSNY